MSNDLISSEEFDSSIKTNADFSAPKPNLDKVEGKDVEKFKMDLEHVKEVLIKKLYDNKLINTISTNEKNDIEIVKNIFTLRIINLEYIYIKIKKKENKYIVYIFDEKETLEKEIEMYLEFNKKDKIKLNKKVKLFNTIAAMK